MYVGYSSEDGPVLLTQIAGLVARRIVCRLKKATGSNGRSASA